MVYYHRLGLLCACLPGAIYFIFVVEYAKKFIRNLGSYASGASFPRGMAFCSILLSLLVFFNCEPTEDETHHIFQTYHGVSHYIHLSYRNECIHHCSDESHQ